MKKFLALLLVAALALTFVACGSKTTEETPATTEAETYDIVFCADLGTINDNGFNQGTWEGCQKYAKENNLTCNYLQPAEDSDDARITIFTQAVEQWKASVVVTCGFLWDTALASVAANYPDVKVIFIDGDASLNGITNVAPINFAEQEVGFLAGYACVKEGYRSLAFFGGMAVPAVIRFGYGFVYGADYAAKELGLAKGDVKMKYWYSGDFNATPEKATTVSGWYETGTEVVFSCGGNILGSAISAAEAAEGRYLVGVDTDEAAKSERIITSAMKSLTNATYSGITAAYAGGADWDAIGGKLTTYGTANNGVQLPDDFSRFKNFTKADYDAIFAKLAADEGGISSAIPTDATYATPDLIPLEYVTLEFLG
ncbi:MAG: BMP family ABC transporter substrate-binding protein [Oscillospiraceae bacterium]|nr:BMP family ABC transporter substrate-binding protein [Oscillospiraceae bacterium]